MQKSLSSSRNIGYSFFALAPVAQLDRASDFESECRGFKSLRVLQANSVCDPLRIFQPLPAPPQKTYRIVSPIHTSMYSAALLLAALRPILLTKRSLRHILAFDQPQLVVSISEKPK
jgi:hypothetical protein